MIMKGDYKKDFVKKLPVLDEATMKRLADIALEIAMIDAKSYPPQMQDLIVYYGVNNFLDQRVALMVLDILYSNGTFKPLTEEEKITSQLIMFSDILPE